VVGDHQPRILIGADSSGLEDLALGVGDERHQGVVGDGDRLLRRSDHQSAEREARGTDCELPGDTGGVRPQCAVEHDQARHTDPDTEPGAEDSRPQCVGHGVHDVVELGDRALASVLLPFGGRVGLIVEPECGRGERLADGEEGVAEVGLAAYQGHSGDVLTAAEVVGVPLEPGPSMGAVSGAVETRSGRSLGGGRVEHRLWGGVR
jgi:hypothetical protein